MFQEVSDHNIRIYKLLSIVGFVLITLALIVIAKTPAATGYELSIYNAYPIGFWVLIAAAFACGICILIHQAFAEEKSNWWIAGLCIVIFSNALFLGLPFFHAYAFYPTGDALTHLGHMKDIIVTGHVGQTNYYPIVHILGVDILSITGLSREVATNLLFVFFSVLYLLNMYLLATRLASRRGQILLITAFACPLIFSTYHGVIHPSIFSIFILPLLLYFYHRAVSSPANKAQNIALLFLVVLLMTFFHPITALFAIAVLLVFVLASYLHRKLAPVTNTGAQLRTSKNSTKFALITGIVMIIFFSSWYISFPSIHRSLGKVHSWLDDQITDQAIEPSTTEPSPIQPPVKQSLFQSLIQNLSKAKVMQTLALFIARYGAVFIYLLMALIISIVVLRKFLIKKFKRKGFQQLDFIYSIQFLVALLISAYMLFGYALEYNELRIVRLPLIMATILGGLVIYEFIHTDSTQRVNLDRFRPGGKALIGIITVLVLAVGVLSIFNVYGSPMTVQSNSQVSLMKIAGAGWFISHQDRDIAVAQTGLTLGRFEDFTFGVESRSFTRAKVDPQKIPSHFGYDKNDSISQTFNFEERYLLTCESSRINVMIFPENVRNKVHQYSEEDYAKLRADPVVAQVYANSGFEVWRMYGQNLDRVKN